MTTAFEQPAPAAMTRRARRAARKAAADEQPKRPSLARRTGSGATINIDNVVVHYVAVILLSAAVLAGGTGSIEGLWHAASWAEPVELQWTLPTAVDVFLVGTALLSLIFRRRRKIGAAILAAAVTIALVSFSSFVNYQRSMSVWDPATDPDCLGPVIKAAMPWLLLVALELLAMLLSVKNVGEKSAIAKRDAQIKHLRSELAAAKKANKTASRLALPELAVQS